MLGLVGLGLVIVEVCVYYIKGLKLVMILIMRF